MQLFIDRGNVDAKNVTEQKWSYLLISRRFAIIRDTLNCFIYIHDDIDKRRVVHLRDGYLFCYLYILWFVVN